MDTTQVNSLSYPIGKYVPQPFSVDQKLAWLTNLKQLPNELELAVRGLSDAQLQTPYRDGGWTPQQVVHHLADAHMNGYIRFKLGITEYRPVIKPYQEEKWAMLDDIDETPVEVSLNLLYAMHHRWWSTIKNFSEADFEKTVTHPEQGRQLSLWFLLGLYAWHGKHHVAHITSLRERKGW